MTRSDLGIDLTFGELLTFYRARWGTWRAMRRCGVAPLRRDSRHAYASGAGRVTTATRGAARNNDRSNPAASCSSGELPF